MMSIRKLAWAFLDELDGNILERAQYTEDLLKPVCEKHMEPLKGKVPPELLDTMWKLQRESYHAALTAVREALMVTFFGHTVDFVHDTEENLNYEYYARNPDKGIVTLFDDEEDDLNEDELEDDDLEDDDLDEDDLVEDDADEEPFLNPPQLRLLRQDESAQDLSPLDSDR